MPPCLDVTKNVFYWTRVAIIVAQGSGMHRRLVARSGPDGYALCLVAALID